MEELKIELDRRITLKNLCEPEIVKLSQMLDIKIVEQQRKMLKGVN